MSPTVAGMTTITRPATRLNKKFIKEGVMDFAILSVQQQASANNFNGLS
jgi:hypothetical protein